MAKFKGIKHILKKFKSSVKRDFVLRRTLKRKSTVTKSVKAIQAIIDQGKLQKSVGKGKEFSQSFAANLAKMFAQGSKGPISVPKISFATVMRIVKKQRKEAGASALKLHNKAAAQSRGVTNPLLGRQKKRITFRRIRGRIVPIRVGKRKK